MQNCRMGLLTALRSLLVLTVLLGSAPVWAAYAYALWGDLKYPPGFAQFDYVNPAAPKRGELRLVSITTAVFLIACLFDLISLQTW